MRRTSAFLAALGVALLAVADQPFDIRPGLWNITTHIDAGAGLDAYSRRSCITAEDIRHARVLRMAAAESRSCTSQVTRQSADTLEGVVDCTTQAGASRTEISFTASSPTKFSGRMKAVRAGAQGVEIAMEAEWSATACPAGEEEKEGEED